LCEDFRTPAVTSIPTHTAAGIDAENVRASRWHTDSTYVDALPLFSVLRGVAIPPVGGDTVWVNTVAAYETLPPPLRGLAVDYAATRPNATARQL
jgi:alpha-ketoglutarate-dependent sulfate ester dioxygenase